MPTDCFLLFQLAEERKTTVGILLLGQTIPLYNAELELYKTYQTALARFKWQQDKGIT
jgi:hypothetical protein